jgi:hypothetical protein
MIPYDLRLDHATVRDSFWITKDGSKVTIGSMSDKHLLNAYKKFGDERLFREMMVRLFETRVDRQDGRIKI